MNDTKPMTLAEMITAIKLLVPALRHALSGCGGKIYEGPITGQTDHHCHPCPECADAREKLEKIDGRE
ncbi:MAG: hypothetical protein V3W44_08700 [Dehalococcoidales bacterium]